jgi:hypothetical protein
VANAHLQTWGCPHEKATTTDAAAGTALVCGGAAVMCFVSVLGVVVMCCCDHRLCRAYRADHNDGSAKTDVAHFHPLEV